MKNLPNLLRVIILFISIVSCGRDKKASPLIESSKFRQLFEEQIEREYPISSQKRRNHFKPKYYNGDMPFILEETLAKLKFARKKYSYVISQVFDNWRTDFVYLYNPSMRTVYAEIARTVNNSGKLIAEARFIRFVEKGERYHGGSQEDPFLEIEEFHYKPNGKLKFKCKSIIDYHGYKVEENDITGEKDKDYYFMWPAESQLSISDF